MVMVLNKRVLRVIAKNKAQYFGAIALVVLSCLMFALLNLMSIDLNTSEKQFTEHNALEDAKAILQNPLTNASNLEKQYDVTIEQRHELDTTWQDNITLRLFDKSEKVNIPAVTNGADLKSDNDILLTETFATAHGLKIGDKIQLEGQNFQITGFASIPDYIYALKSESDLVVDPNTFSIAVISKNKMQELKKGTTTYNIKYHSNRSHDLKTALQQSNNILYWRDIKENPRYTLVVSKIDQITALAVQLPSFVLLLTCLLLATTMWRMIKMEFTSIGTLYAMGYQKREIVMHYLRYPLFISLVGGLVGTLLGWAVVAPMNGYLGSYFNIPMQHDTAAGFAYVVGSVLIPLVFLVPATLFVVWRALRLRPVELMKGQPQKKKSRLQLRSLPLGKLSFSGKFRLRELTRNFSKTLLMLFGVLMASMFLLFGFVSQSSISYVLNDGYTNTYKYQYNTTFNTLQTENTYGGERYNAAPFFTGDHNFVIYGLQPDAKLIEMNTQAGDKLAFDKNIITKPLADALGVKAGDTVNVTNKLTDKPYSVKIDAIAETYTGNSIYLPLAKFNQLIGLPEPSFIGIYSKDKLHVEDAKIMKVEDREDTIRAFNSALEPMKYMLLLMGSMAFLIALIVIYVITSLIIEENKGNISMFKVLGYTAREINSLVLNAGRMTVVIGFLLAIPTTFASIDAMLKSVVKGIDIAFPITVSPWYVILSFVVIYSTYELSKWLAKKKVFAVSMAESLKMQRY